MATTDSIFPVAHYEFVWAHQLWNHGKEADRYFQYYLDHYILPNGDFLYNLKQHEAPLNVGVFLATWPAPTSTDALFRLSRSGYPFLSA